MFSFLKFPHSSCKNSDIVRNTVSRALIDGIIDMTYPTKNDVDRLRDYLSKVHGNDGFRLSFGQSKNLDYDVPSHSIQYLRRDQCLFDSIMLEGFLPSMSCHEWKEHVRDCECFLSVRLGRNVKVLELTLDSVESEFPVCYPVSLNGS